MRSALPPPAFDLEAIVRLVVRLRAGFCWLLMLGSPSWVAAQSATSVPVSNEEEPVVLDTFEVQGFREGLAKARLEQREAPNLKDILSVDAVGKLPDSNVAEALQRLPSAFLTNSRGGDGRFVSVRGIDPLLNNVTMNGQTIGMSDVDGRGGRAAPLDVLSASALESIEVIKSPTPDMDGQGLGATINFTTPSAFDHQGWFVYGSAKVGFNDLVSDGDNYEADINFGTTFGAKNQFGLVIGASYSKRDFIAFEVSREGYRVFGRNPNEYFGVDGTPNPFGVIAVSADMTLRTFFGDKERKGGNLNFEWRPTDGTELWVRGFKTDYREFLRKTQLRLRTSNLNANTTRFISPTEMFTTRGAVETETEYGDTFRPVEQITVGGRRQLNEAWSVDGNITITGAEEDKPGGTLLADEFSNSNFQNGLGNVPENATYAIDTSGLFPIYRTVFDDPTTGWPGTGDIGDLSFYPFFRIRREFSHVEEDTKTYDLNVIWEREIAGRPGFLKAGVKFLDREKSVDDRSLRYLPTETIFLSDTFVDGNLRLPYGIMNQDLVGRFRLGPADGLYARYMGATHNAAAFEAELARNIGPTLDASYDEITNTPDPATSIANPERWTFDEIGSRQNSVEDDYDLAEEIFAYYLMGDYNLTDRLKLVAGVRVEHTDASMSAFLLQDLRANGTFALLPNGPVDRDFTNVLPAVHLRWDATERILVRASYTTSIGRPDYKDMSPIGRSFQIQAGPTPDIFIGSLQEGNPSLEPLEAQNYDVSAAYYFAGGRGMFSVGLFHKEIENAIYDFRYNPLTDDVNLAGKPFTRDVVDGIPVVNFRGFQFSSLSISTKNNAPRSHVSGLELNYQQELTFLPAPFDNLGVAANVAFMDSEATLLVDRPTGDNEVPYFLQPDAVANIQLYYQQRGFEARVAWHYQDDALAAVGSDPLIDKFWRARAQFDAKIGYRLNNHWGIFVEGRNLTDEPNRTYFAFDRDSLGGETNLPGYDVNGRTIFFGLNYRFGN